MQGTVDVTNFTTWPFWVCSPMRANDFTPFTILTRALVQDRPDYKVRQNISN